MGQPELETLEVSHQDQVWVADITYVRLKGRFIYLSAHGCFHPNDPGPIRSVST